MQAEQAHVYDIDGLSCAACASSAQKILRKSSGVKNAIVNFATQTAWVEPNNPSLELDDLNAHLEPLGFRLHLPQKNQSFQYSATKLKARHQLQKEILLALTAGLLGLLLNNFYDTWAYLNVFQWLLGTIVVVYAGARFFKSAWHQLTWWRVNMDSLVALGVGTAYSISTVYTFFPWLFESVTQELLYFDTAIMLLFFILLGKFLESKSLQKTAGSIDALLSLQPDKVCLVDGTETCMVPIEMIAIGDVIRVRTGERIAVDGQCLRGNASVDESMLTGESMPLFKNEGTACFAGSLVCQGTLYFVVTEVGQQTSLQQIIRMVESAQNSQLPVQELVDRVVQVFVPVVLMLSFITLGTWTYLGSFSQGLVHAVSVWVVACPCALGLATPVAVVVGIGKAAQKGILFSRAEALQQMATVDTILLDKTGTITCGHPKLIDIEWQTIDSDQKETYLSIMLGLEEASVHPLAAAFLTHFDHKIKPAVLENIVHYPGMGLAASLDNKKYGLGNARLLKRLGQALQKDSRPFTKVYFCEEKQLIATLLFDDPIKASAPHTVVQLKALYSSLSMLTGDSRAVAHKVAQEVGIISYYASLLPKDKLDHVAALMQAGKKVMMVGDGINDAPALVQSTVGIAMHNGANVAIASADVVIRSQNLEQIVEAAQLSKATMRTIQQNLGWAFLYNILLLPVAAGLFAGWGVFLHPMLSAAAMSMSSLLVVSNSLRLYLRD